MAEGMHVRVYHEDLIEHFPAIWDDNPALATWLRLLVVADKLWPSPGEMPQGVSRTALAKLVEVGLVQLLPKHRYRIRGLDADRSRRRDAAKHAADERWSGRSADGIAESNAPRNASAMPRTDGRARPQSVSVSVDPSSGEIGVPGEEGPDAVIAYHQLTGRFPVTRAKDWIDRLAKEYGHTPVTKAMVEAITADRDVHTLLSRTQDQLAIEAHAAQIRRSKHTALDDAEYDRVMADSMTDEQRATNRARLRAMLEETGVMAKIGGNRPSIRDLKGEPA